nr:FAD-dependent oxidoreductase [Ruegeria sp. HKCCD7255]
MSAVNKPVEQKPKYTILGGGPAGLATAHLLARDTEAEIALIDRAPRLGGNAASFEIEGIITDYGSHRFHPAADPHVMNEVKSLLGDDLLLRPRHGRIRLGGRWIHFPLKLGNALKSLPLPFATSLIRDMVTGPLRRAPEGPATFSSVLLKGLGPTISENFYFPYVRKLWGLDPSALAVKLAERRVSGSSVSKIVMKMVRMLPGLRGETTGRFFYPRKGFGQICESMADSARRNGAEIRLEEGIERVERDGNTVTAVITKDKAGVETRHESSQVLSTIPLTALLKAMHPAPPPQIVAAAEAIRFRSMILIYMVLETGQFTEYDAHYFPEISIPISRMSETKNYNNVTAPEGLTVLCAELPCDPTDPWWEMSDDELGAHFQQWLGSVDLPVNVPVRKVITRRLSHAYPVYDVDYADHFAVVDDWLESLDGLVNFGRQGLFAHDNTHHAFAMSFGIADCLGADGSFDQAKWTQYREKFSHHVVED